MTYYFKKLQNTKFENLCIIYIIYIISFKYSLVCLFKVPKNSFKFRIIFSFSRFKNNKNELKIKKEMIVKF